MELPDPNEGYIYKLLLATIFKNRKLQVERENNTLLQERAALGFRCDR
jgi:hypothetical protein